MKIETLLSLSYLFMGTLFGHFLIASCWEIPLILYTLHTNPHNFGSTFLRGLKDMQFKTWMVNLI